MAYTQEAIYNIALNHLGVSATVQNTSEVNARNHHFMMMKLKLLKN